MQSRSRPRVPGSGRSSSVVLLEALGSGLLRSPHSSVGREALRLGALTPTGFQNLILSVLYRVIFLETVVERGNVPSPLAPVREVRSWSHLLHIFQENAERLGASSDADGLFSTTTPSMFKLFDCDPGTVKSFVMGVRALLDELPIEERPDLSGSLHERLMSLRPVVRLEHPVGFHFGFGAARKSNGVYYTPRPVAAHLVDMAMFDARQSGVLGENAMPTICDPACGSGTFLVAVARQLAGLNDDVTRRCDGATQGPQRWSMTELVTRALHGVDRDPLAVAICRARLWLEACDPNLPLAALERRIIRGNALFGAVRPLVEGCAAEREALDGWAWQCAGLSAFDRRDDLDPPMHWHLAFPDIFTRGGFDVLLCNPPWELLQPEERSFFAAAGRSDISMLAGNKRKTAIQRLAQEDPSLLEAWLRHRANLAALARFASDSGRFPLEVTGKRNLYGMFLESARDLLEPGGVAGYIVPAGFLTDQSMSSLLRSLMESGSIASCRHFFNHRGLFPDIASNQAFCLLTLRRGNGTCAPTRFGLRLESLDAAVIQQRQIGLSVEDVALLNPNTRTCVLLTDTRELDLARRIYKRVPVLVRESRPRANPWNIEMRQGQFNMTADSHRFLSSETRTSSGLIKGANVEEIVPLYEAKMFHQFDSKWRRDERNVSKTQQGTRPNLPRYWVRRRELGRRLPRWPHPWVLGVRLVCRATDSRTVIASILPTTACGNSVLLLMSPDRDAADHALLMACLNSLALDYLVRQKLGGANLNFHILKQLPVLPPERFELPAPFLRCSSVRSWLLPRVLELVYVEDDQKPFAEAAGFQGPAYQRDADRRAYLRAEIDAAFFLLYGYNRDEVEYSLDTFAVLERSERRRWGEYRTRRTVLHAFDRLDR